MNRKIFINTAALMVGFVGCGFGLHKLMGSPTYGTSADSAVVLSNLNQPTPETARPQSPITSAARTVMPAVVTIDTVSKPVTVGNPMANDPFFRQFFGNVAPQTERQRGVGSGVLISQNGYILTNNHVISNADNIHVTLYNGKSYDAKLIGTDPTTDVAVCKIESGGVNLPYAQLGESKTLEIGDEVIAIGDPLNVGTTVTSGIVSALGHRNDSVTAGPRPLASDIIQTDAAINPGNSGGALADLNGKVVGINEAIYSETGGFVGIGFAIPIDTARDVAEQLIKTGEVVRPYIGVSYDTLAKLTAKDRSSIGVTVTGDDGAIVMDVMPHSPAAEAGLERYDVILEANRQKITSDPNSLKSIISKVQVGGTLVLLVNRDGKDQLISVTVKKMPKDFGDPTANQQQQDQQNQQDPNQGSDNGNNMFSPGF
jgi:S1-C subfamily serine protease